jgi:nicotinamide-nucleotide amidase
VHSTISRQILCPAISPLYEEHTKGSTDVVSDRVTIAGLLPAPGRICPEAERAACAVRQETGASHALAVLIEVDDGPNRIDFGGIRLAIATEEGIESRRSRIYGGRDWVRLGAVELGLDSLRRQLQGLPVTERTDFERV